MSESTLEKIDIIKERTGISYTDAREALDNNGGDLVDTLIYLNERKKSSVDDVFTLKKGISTWIKRMVKSGQETQAQNSTKQLMDKLAEDVMRKYNKDVLDHEKIGEETYNIPNFVKKDDNIYYLNDIVVRNGFMDMEKVEQILNNATTNYYDQKKYEKAYKIYESILALLDNHAKENLYCFKYPINSHWDFFLSLYSCCLLTSSQSLYMLKKYDKAWIYSLQAASIYPFLDDESMNVCNTIYENSINYLGINNYASLKSLIDNVVSNKNYSQEYFTSKQTPLDSRKYLEDSELIFELKNALNINKSFNTSDLPQMLTEKFYISTYDCPLCNSKLHKSVFPRGKEFPIRTTDKAFLIKRIFTCSKCKSFFAPIPGQALDSGSALTITHIEGYKYNELLLLFNSKSTTDGRLDY